MPSNSSKHRRIAALCAAIALLAAITSGAGLVFRGDGTTETVESVRGETYEMVTSGVYAYNAQRVVAEGIGWDVVTLVLAAPALLLAAVFVARGSLRGHLLAIGILAYTFYQYLMYAVYWDIGPLFPLYIVLYAASAFGIGWTISAVPVAELPNAAGDGFPRIGFAILSFVVALVLVGMWSGRIATALGGEIEGVLLGQDTLDVQALDLGMIVPLAAFTGIALLQRRPVGYLLATVLAVKAVTMASAIAAMLISAWFVEGALEVAPFAFFVVVAVVSLWLGARMYRSLPA